MLKSVLFILENVSVPSYNRSSNVTNLRQIPSEMSDVIDLSAVFLLTTLVLPRFLERKYRKNLDHLDFHNL